MSEKLTFYSSEMSASLFARVQQFIDALTDRWDAALKNVTEDRDGLRKIINEAHAELDKSNLILKRADSHRSLPDRIEGERAAREHQLRKLGDQLVAERQHSKKVEAKLAASCDTNVKEDSPYDVVYRRSIERAHALLNTAPDLNEAAADATSNVPARIKGLLQELEALRKANADANKRGDELEADRNRWETLAKDRYVRLQNEQTYCKKLDGLIEEVGGITASCINPYEDLKNALRKLKKDREDLRGIVSYNGEVIAARDAQIAQLQTQIAEGAKPYTDRESKWLNEIAACRRALDEANKFGNSQHAAAERYWKILCETTEALGRTVPEATPYIAGGARQSKRELDSLREKIQNFKNTV